MLALILLDHLTFIQLCLPKVSSSSCKPQSYVRILKVVFKEMLRRVTVLWDRACIMQPCRFGNDWDVTIQFWALFFVKQPLTGTYDSFTCNAMSLLSKFVCYTNWQSTIKASATCKSITRQILYPNQSINS